MGDETVQWRQNEGEWKWKVKKAVPVGAGTLCCSYRELTFSLSLVMGMSRMRQVLTGFPQLS